MNLVSNKQIVDSLDSIKNEILNGSNHHRSENVHRFFQYPAMMVPSVQEPIIQTLAGILPSDSWIIDPFMGSATTLVSSMKHGFNIYGQDINPLSILISQVKTGPYDFEELHNAYEIIRSLIREDKVQKNDLEFTNIDKWFNKDIQIELSTIRRSILSQKNIEIRKFFWVAFAETIRLSSNDRTSTFKLHMRSVEDLLARNISSLDVFKEMCKRNLNDLMSFRETLNSLNLLEKNNYKSSKVIAWGDSAISVNSKEHFNLLITSPPYGDNRTTVTYGQHSYLPLQWIPFEDIDSSISQDFLKTTQEIDRRSLGGRNDRKNKDEKDEILEKSPELQKLCNSFDDSEKLKLKKVFSFIIDLDKSITNSIAKLNKNAFLVWTIGNRHVSGKEIKNDRILTELLQSKGIELITDLDRVILNKRMPSRNNFSQTMSKEKILILRKPF